MQLMLLKL